MWGTSDNHNNLCHICAKELWKKKLLKEEEEVIKIIYKFNQNKSAGHDGIGNFIVKRIAKEISVPLTLIFNTSISTGIVPDELKIAKVIPIYKKDSPEVFSNYRPVSVLPCFSKILKDWFSTAA